MVALLAGKGIALAAGKPLIAVNHLEGHALSPRLADPDLDFPYLLLLVSGGHCQLLEVRGVGAYRRLATTIDDAAGEAFDKAAKLLGLAYPGGPAIEELAAQPVTSTAVPLPRPLIGSPEPHFPCRPQERGPSCDRLWRAQAQDIAASFRQRVSTAPVDAPALALASERCTGIGGRRRCRGQSRDPLGAQPVAARHGRGFSVPPAWLCTDNAAMIAWAGAERLDWPDRRPTRRRGPVGRSTRKRGRSAVRGSRHEDRSHRRRRLGHRAGASRRGVRARKLDLGARG
jgi:N6-L-threonylcarbamoyladenine synthase